MMKQFFALLMLLVSVQPLQAAVSQAEFDALAMQTAPGQPPRQARMFVTPQYVRMEFDNQGERTIEITDLQSRRTLQLYPKQRLFSVREAAPNLLQQQNKTSTDPCSFQPEGSCRQLGTETVFGRNTEKWEMTVEHQGKSYRSLYWVDSERAMPLRQYWADGTVAELKPLDEVMLNGRPTEKWQMTTTRADGNSVISNQWLDKELQMVVREELPGGYVRELRDIQVRAQDPALFGIPDGYRPMPGAPGGAAGK